MSRSLSLMRQGTVLLMLVMALMYQDRRQQRIEVNVGSCDDARQQVNDVIANLSAISEQNAASAEETTASMQELTATISLLSTTANDLMKISEKLNSEMKFFKI